MTRILSHETRTRVTNIIAESPPPLFKQPTLISTYLVFLFKKPSLFCHQKLTILPLNCHLQFLLSDKQLTR